MPSLVTSRLLLRPFQDDDFEAVCAFRGDERVMRDITGSPETPEEIAAFLHRLFADCVAENSASARVMQKVGMHQEGRFRQNKRIGEQWHDTLRYALLDWEWRK